MKFVLDAQLPVFLCHWLSENGYPSTHTLFLKERNRTSDNDLLKYVLREKGILVTKDLDFYESFLVKREPEKLLLVTTGNIKNRDLKLLFEKNITKISDLFQNHHLIELTKTQIIIHQ